MAVRAIDAVQVLHNINLHHRPTPVSEFESGFNDGLNQAMWEITHAPTLTPPNEWVSVEDRLPASGQNVIATNGSDVGEAWYASLSRSWYRYNGLEWNRICREVTHWMPLPEPPDRRPPEGEEDNG